MTPERFTDQLPDIILLGLDAMTVCEGLAIKATV